MSLEDKIAANTAAVEALAAAIAAQTALIEKGVSKAGAKPAETPAEKPAEKAKPKAASKPKAPTSDDLLKVFGGYLAASDDKDEKKRRVATVKPILEHFGVAKVSEIEGDALPEAIDLGKKLMAAYEDGGIEAAEALDLELSNEDAGGDAEDLM